MVSSESIVTRSPEPVETTVGDEVILMSLATGECYGLGETGSEVWRLLAEPVRVSTLIASLREAYEAPLGVLEDDVRGLLDDLAARGLVTIT